LVDKILKLFSSELRVINIGLELFNDALKAQGVDSVQVSWQPAPKLEKEYDDILQRIM
jgi:hypothetical protein